MPIIKSARKRMRQTEKRRQLNVVTKKAFRTSVKDFTAALESKDSVKISDALRAAQSDIDTAVKKNLLHKNTASRKKAALSAKAKAAGMKVTASAKTSKPATKPPTVKAAPAKKPAAKKPATKKA